MNKHFKVAEANIAAASNVNDGRLLIAAQAFATLALAYEQRTANLIAYATTIDDTDAAVFAQIKERLGLA